MSQGVRRVFALPLVLLAAGFLCACQSPTESTDTLDVDDFVDSSVAPDPATAVASTGKYYRVVRGNNQPDDILEYDWKTTFAVTVSINSNATDDTVDLAFPVAVTSATVKIEQASGGIVSVPTGGEVEHYESSIASASSNKIAAVGGAITMVFDVWYDLPNLGKEALATVTISFRDNDGLTFAKTVTVKVAP